MGFEPTTTGITIQDSTAELRPPLSSWATGTPDRIRTCYPRLRRPVLYPDELRALLDPDSRWSGWRDSNPRHLAPKASALPDCATPRERELYVGSDPVLPLLGSGSDPGLQPPTAGLRPERAAG